MYRDAVHVEHELYDESGRVWATGVVTKGLENVEAIPEKRSIDSLQRAAVSPAIRKVLQLETWSLSSWDHLSFNVKISRKKELWQETK